MRSWIRKPIAVIILVAVIAIAAIDLSDGGQSSGQPSLSPPDITNQNGVYVLFSGGSADQLAAAFQQGAAKNGTYWTTFTTGPSDYSITCRLHEGGSTVEVAKATSALEAGVEGQICAGFVSDGWHQ